LLFGGWTFLGAPGCKTVVNEDGSQEIVLDLEVVHTELGIFAKQIDALIQAKGDNEELVADLIQIRGVVAEVDNAVERRIAGDPEAGLSDAAGIAAGLVKTLVVDKWLQESDDTGQVFAALALQTLLLHLEAYA
jgi:hypothetical protein